MNVKDILLSAEHRLVMYVLANKKSKAVEERK